MINFEGALSIMDLLRSHAHARTLGRLPRRLGGTDRVILLPILGSPSVLA